jgi:hypothetical protein
MKNMLRILLLTMIICCWSCGSGGEDIPTPTPTPKPEEKPKVEVTTTAPVLSQEGGTASVTFTSTADWTIDVTEGRAVSWCTVSPTSGSKGTSTLTITSTGNDTYDERNAKVTIKAGATTQSFTITQKQKDTILIAKNEYSMEAVGGELKFDVNTNVDFMVETSVDWIVQSTESRGLESKPLSFTIAENTSDDSREGLITISSGDLKQNIKVVQKAKSTFSVSQSEFRVGSDGGDIHEPSGRERAELQNGQGMQDVRSIPLRLLFMEEEAGEAGGDNCG